MKTVGVLRGGDFENYEDSLREGAEIISYIISNFNNEFDVLDIFVDRKGVWHLKGLPIIPSTLVHKVDVVWNTAHPNLAQILESFSIPVIGSSSFNFSISQNRALLGEQMKNIGIDMPRHLLIPAYQKDFDGGVEEYVRKKTREVFGKFSPPWIVRSLSKNSSMGVHVAKMLIELEKAIADGVDHGVSILIEEFITGKVAYMHSVSGFRNQNVYVFPVCTGESFNSFSKNEKEKLETISKDLHKHLGVKRYLKSSFIVHPKGKIYLTGVNLSPNLKDNSHFRQSCESVGAKTSHIIKHILEQALK